MSEYSTSGSTIAMPENMGPHWRPIRTHMHAQEKKGKVRCEYCFCWRWPGNCPGCGAGLPDLPKPEPLQVTVLPRRVSKREYQKLVDMVKENHQIGRTKPKMRITPATEINAFAAQCGVGCFIVWIVLILVYVFLF